MLPQYSVFAVLSTFICVATLMICGILFLSWCVRPLKQRPKAQETYECGMEAEGNSRNIGFHFIGYAVLFLLFDIAALYLFLYAFVAKPPVPVTISFLLGMATLSIVIIVGTKRRKYHVA